MTDIWQEIKPLESEVMTQWVSRYREWVSEGVRHVIRGDGYDPTQYRISVEREPGEDTWANFLEDYSPQSEATYVSGAGLAWLRNSAVLCKDIEEAWRFGLGDHLGQEEVENEIEGSDPQDVVDAIGEIVAVLPSRGEPVEEALIEDALEDSSLWPVYADWLEDHGQTDRAERVRILFSDVILAMK